MIISIASWLGTFLRQIVKHMELSVMRPVSHGIASDPNQC